MANAKKCDICGKYYDAPNIPSFRLDYDEQLDYIHTHSAETNITMRFDSCKKCYQDVLDYILSKSAESSDKVAE